MERYIKHTNFAPIGVEGQKKLLGSKILIIGAGGLGCSFINYFARSGVGDIRIIDKDKVELSNLQRQALYYESDIGKYKAECALQRVNDMNSQIKAEAHVLALGPNNAHELIMDRDLVIDATDNFSTRFLIDSVCVELKKPWLFTGIIGASAQTMLINYPVTKRLTDIVPNDASTTSIEPQISSSVIFQAVSSISALASMIALKYLIGIDYHPNKMYCMDIWEYTLKELEL